MSPAKDNKPIECIWNVVARRESPDYSTLCLAFDPESDRHPRWLFNRRCGIDPVSHAGSEISKAAKKAEWPWRNAIARNEGLKRIFVRVVPQPLGLLACLSGTNIIAP